jgi:hypothetical protein
MPASNMWGWDKDAKVWRPILVNDLGQLIIDPSEVTLDKLGDVNVPTPANHDIIDWDAATSKWVKRSLGNMGAHAARHEWQGDDELDIKDIFTHLPYVHFDFTTIDPWTLGTLGSGSSNWVGPGCYVLNTGATINSEAYIYTGNLGFSYPERNTQHWMWQVSIRQATGEIAYIFANQASSGIPPGLTEKHAGFRTINRRVWASNADGTTEKATDTGVDLGQGSVDRLDMVGTGSSIKYYVNGVLKATHTENLPASWSYKNLCYITNTVAENKQIWICNASFIVA